MYCGIHGITACSHAASPPPPDTDAPESDWPVGHVDGSVLSQKSVNTLMKHFDNDLGMLQEAYRKAGVYPHNFVRSGPLNVWMDSEGHLCAAATMIDKDGKHFYGLDYTLP